MHSRAMSRRRNLASDPTFQIGDKVKRVLFDTDGTRAKLINYLRQHGDPMLNNTRQGNAYGVWYKVRHGIINGETAKNIERDRAAQFAEFDRQAAMAAKQ